MEFIAAASAARRDDVVVAQCGMLARLEWFELSATARSSDKVGTIQGRLALPVRKGDMHKSRGAQCDLKQVGAQRDCKPFVHIV